MERFDYIIDIQAFHDKDGVYLPKEIAIVALDYNFISHWIVKPPCAYDELPKGIISTNSYLTCYQHGLEWYDGESTLEDVYSSLRVAARDAQNIYVRGFQKVNLLERVLGRNIVNLEEYSCPSFKNLPQVDDHFCIYHGGKADHYSCALTYAYKLRIWLRKTLYNYNDIARDDYKKKKNIPKKPARAVVDSCSSDVKTTTNISAPSPTGVIKEEDTTSATVIAAIAKSGGNILEPLYSNPYDEHSTTAEGVKRNSGTDGRSLPCRQDTEGVDEAGCYYC